MSRVPERVLLALLTVAVALVAAAPSLAAGSVSWALTGGVGSVIAVLCLVTVSDRRRQRSERATRREMQRARRRLRQTRRVLARRITRLQAGIDQAATAGRAATAQSERAITADAVRRQAATHDRMREEVAGLVDRLRLLGMEETAQVEALLQLVPLAGLREAIPRTRNFPASPDALLTLADTVRARRPKLCVDLGSGTSSIVLASTIRLLGYPGRVVAIDHDEEYARLTRELAHQHGLDDWLEIRHAPLVATDGCPEVLWYDPELLDDLRDVDLVFVDGPPGSTGPRARTPAYGFLADRLADGAAIVLDDADRADEAELVALWSADPRAVGLQRPPAEKGLAVIMWGVHPRESTHLA